MTNVLIIVDIIQEFRSLVRAKDVQKALGRYSTGYINKVLSPKYRKKNKAITDCAEAIIMKKINAVSQAA